MKVDSRRRRLPAPRETSTLLQQQLEQNRINLVQTELKVAETMLHLSNTTKNAGHRERLLNNARIAIDAARRFGSKIRDRHVRDDLHEEADRLERDLRHKSGTM